MRVNPGGNEFSNLLAFSLSVTFNVYRNCKTEQERQQEEEKNKKKCEMTENKFQNPFDNKQQQQNYLLGSI